MVIGGGCFTGPAGAILLRWEAATKPTEVWLRRGLRLRSTTTVSLEDVCCELCKSRPEVSAVGQIVGLAAAAE
ncbi:hypothetical protein NDU88_003568 [Pleurodeles waltl]|uniref:Uncharacterized protein n=1 Tax=Pleurodeles waltl TaxID=8319 RepID=A0AAV7M4E2_PLEWA|nr:hypothetical protein NDU88_003568 [Pleurodeles waltl]